MRSFRALRLALGAVLLAYVGCGGDDGTTGDSGQEAGADDAGRDAGSPDAARPDAGELRACTEDDECTVVPESCCGSCGAATRGDAIGVHRDRASAYSGMACSGSVGCPACYMQQDPTLIATCREGQCTVVDLQQHEVTECTGASECRLRTRDCCECGGDSSRGGLIAVRTDAEATYTSLVCAEGAPCPECAPSYPQEAEAICSSGRCEVQWDGGP